MRILICGDRYWHRGKRDIIVKAMAELPKGTVIIEGENGDFGSDGKVIMGVDKMAREIAEEMGLKVEPYPADWDRYGKGAGPKRNTQMLKQGKPDEVWAFHPDIDRSKGTRNMVTQALDAHVTVRIFK